MSETQTQGASWRKLTSKKTFEEADAIRNDALLQEGLQAKVKRRSHKEFEVRIRQDPNTVQKAKKKK